jgi:magnesium-transporting ATPase (P-type)
MLMMTGSAVLSEAMLTGESAPVLKASLPLDTPQTVFKPDSGTPEGPAVPSFW